MEQKLKKEDKDTTSNKNKNKPVKSGEKNKGGNGGILNDKVIKIKKSK